MFWSACFTNYGRGGTTVARVTPGFKPQEKLILYLTYNRFAAIIMTILLISICLMALVRYGISHRRRKMKDQEALEDEQRIMKWGAISDNAILCASTGSGPRLTTSSFSGRQIYKLPVLIQHQTNRTMSLPYASSASAQQATLMQPFSECSK
ncbi:unnamed protein product [Gongylonema pulchrum]|uniref:Uncharacterized protein n=1 Tax=Gongylonema pulchrum TaxID=637853 RepID=A0A183DL18_9BILA|nr:unnamed protein product [Gongylonema pulchrum]